MEYVEKIRAAYQRLITPLVQAQTKSQQRCRNQEEIYRCIDAYAKLHLAAEDQVRQQFGLMPVHYRRRG